MTGFKEGMSSLGWGISWLGFWLMIGMINFSSCSRETTTAIKDLEEIKSVITNRKEVENE